MFANLIVKAVITQPRNFVSKSRSWTLRFPIIADTFNKFVTKMLKEEKQVSCGPGNVSQHPFQP